MEHNPTARSDRRRTRRPGRWRPAPAPSGATRTALALAVVVAASLATVASSEEEATMVEDAGESGSDGNGGDNGNGGGEEGTAPAEFSVGDIVELGDWQVQVHGVTDPHTGDQQFLSPDPGNRWVAVDVEVTNRSDSPEIVSSILCFELTDDTNVEYSDTYTGDAAQPPDGEVAPGDARRGTLVYEVPEAASGLQLHFQCDFLTTGSAIIGLG